MNEIGHMILEFKKLDSEGRKEIIKQLIIADHEVRRDE